MGNTIRDASFCDTITNIYEEMVLKIFINTIAKPYVKRLTDSLKPTDLSRGQCTAASHRKSDRKLQLVPDLVRMKKSWQKQSGITQLREKLNMTYKFMFYHIGLKEYTLRQLG